MLKMRVVKSDVFDQLDVVFRGALPIRVVGTMVAFVDMKRVWNQEDRRI